ncbi:MAG: rhodanese [Magnetococcales bacterium]|nr:rhodanese [Magnetococcales bacterium]|tara:strand:+ start:181 stop:483 length:303 start_codon:yes stop_codon:yes gene_type:complete
MQVITAEELYKLAHNDDVIVLDVRELHEVEEQPFKNLDVVHIPMNSVPEKLDELDDEKHIIVACVMGGRSARVCEFLYSRGYENVSNLTGGILAWQKLNF